MQHEGNKTVSRVIHWDLSRYPYSTGDNHSL